MTGLFAILTIDWIFKHIIEFLIIVAFFCFLLYRLLTRPRRLARKAQQAAEQRRQEQARKLEEINRQFEEQHRKEEEEQRRKLAQIEVDTKKAVASVPGSEKYLLPVAPAEVNCEILGITDFTPIAKQRFVAFDNETTGLDGDLDQIIEIAAARVVDGVIVEQFTQLVNPGCTVPAAASAVNNITDDMLIGMPKIYEVLPAFLNFVGDDVLAAHNARFDAKFLARACMRYKFVCPTRYFDTMALARYYPEAGGKSLSKLAAAAGIQNDAAHRALGDARTVAQLILVTNEKRAQKKRTNKEVIE